MNREQRVSLRADVISRIINIAQDHNMPPHELRRETGYSEARSEIKIALAELPENERAEVLKDAEGVYGIQDAPPGGSF